MSEIEVWKDIKNFPNYQVSNYGKIKSKERITNVGIKNIKQIKRKEKILKPLKITKGYLGIRLYNEKVKGKTFKIHRLVAETFIPNPNNYKQINHIDGNKENNKVSNLEWCSNKYNMEHSYKIGLRKNVVKEINQYNLNGNFIKKWCSIMEVQRKLKICNTNISNCCLGKRKSAGGYLWKFA